MIAFWDIAKCGLVEVDQHFRVRNASIIRKMALLKRRNASTKLHDSIFQKSVRIILAAVRK
jgi:hypothetical protein